MEIEAVLLYVSGGAAAVAASCAVFDKRAFGLGGLEVLGIFMVSICLLTQAYHIDSRGGVLEQGKLQAERSAN